MPAFVRIFFGVSCVCVRASWCAYVSHRSVRCATTTLLRYYDYDYYYLLMCLWPNACTFEVCILLSFLHFSVEYTVYSVVYFVLFVCVSQFLSVFLSAERWWKNII